MPERPFTRAQRERIRKFFSDEVKARRLAGIARKQGRRYSPRVFNTNISGLPVTVKLMAREKAARANLSALMNAHRKAVERGEITPRHYVLDAAKYLYADGKVGVMKTVDGIGLLHLDFHEEIDGLMSNAQRIRNHVRFAQEEGASRLGLENAAAEKRRELQFLKNNPGITFAKATTALEELRENLARLSRNQKLFSHDLNTTNINITGVDAAGRLKITLVDQTHPHDAASVLAMLKGSRRARRAERTD